jgi:hypothetical protein
MRSQYIRTRNIPDSIRKNARTIRVKPWGLLVGLFVLGIVVVAMRSYTVGIALPILILTLFSLLGMPDRILIQFTPDYMLVYNRHDRQECTMIYYEDVVSWQYEYHRSSDLLVFNLTDGTSEAVDMYSRHAISRCMKTYLPHKEIRTNRRKSA